MSRTEQIKLGAFIPGALAGGSAWRQTIFWPFAHMSNHGRGRVLRAVVRSETYATAYHDPRGPNDPPIPVPAAPYLKLAAVATQGGGVSLFALNRDLAQPLRMKAELRGFGDLKLVDAQAMHDADLKAANTKDAPDRIKPGPLGGVVVEGGTLAAELPPASWTLLRLAPDA